MSKVLLMIRELGSMQRLGNAVKIGMLLFVTVLAVAILLLGSYSESVNKELADNLIRLHVVANSDSPEDQALKRDVRDLVIGYMKDKLNESKDIEQTRYIINRNIAAIETMARSEIARQGRNYDVKVNLGVYPFPTKVYGDVTLPAGEYQALRVVIGKGEGANWWCVLFPPLCFVDVTHGTVPDSVKADLKATLSSEEYGIITSAADDDEIPVKIKFKVVEFFEDSKIKFTGLISKIFKAR